MSVDASLLSTCCFTAQYNHRVIRDKRISLMTMFLGAPLCAYTIHMFWCFLRQALLLVDCCSQCKVRIHQTLKPRVINWLLLFMKHYMHSYMWPSGESVGLETRGNPRLWVRNPGSGRKSTTVPGRCTVGCPLLQVCALDG